MPRKMRTQRKASKTITPPTPQGVRDHLQMALKSCGKTPAFKRRLSKPEYGKFRGCGKIQSYFARTQNQKCLLCEKDAQIIEHLHRWDKDSTDKKEKKQGPPRGHTCKRCNALVREAEKTTRNKLNVSLEDFEDENKPLPEDFEALCGEELSNRIPTLTAPQASMYITGRLLQEKILDRM